MEDLPPPYSPVGLETAVQDGERIVEIVPRWTAWARRDPLRVVGPGRRERAYLERLERLAALEAELSAGARALETAALLERGSARFLDRLEKHLDGSERRRTEIEQEQHRLILALGALQRENELLREKVARLAAGSSARRLHTGTRSGAAKNRSFWSRLFGRA